MYTFCVRLLSAKHSNLNCFAGIEWILDDDDAAWEIALHLRQRGRVLGPLYGKSAFQISS